MMSSISSSLGYLRIERKRYLLKAISQWMSQWILLMLLKTQRWYPVSSIYNFYFNSEAKGRNNLLLNRKKRFEKKQKELEEEHQKRQSNEYVKELKWEIASFKAEIESLKKNEEESEKNRSILRDLYEKNIIDRDGNLL